jgi:hypothetical protein
MTESKSLEVRLYEGDQAKLVLENEMYQWAFEEIETELTERWKTAPIADQAGRERAFLLLTALRMVQASLTRTLETGKLAQAELNHKRSIAERARDAMRSFE